MFKTMGYSPDFLVKIGQFRILENSPEPPKQSRNQLEIDFQACTMVFREFGVIRRTYENPPFSKPWAMAQAFWSKSANLGSLGIHPKSTQTIEKPVRNLFSGM